MKLDCMVLANWGQMYPGSYEFGEKTLLTGESGSGKSTMLDAIQTVMTAAYPGVYSYNPGQDEVTQGQRRGGKTKRTLESFIVGADRNSFSRVDGAHGYVAAVFRPDVNEDSAKTFTAIVGVSARVDGTGDRRDAKLERLELIIVDDAALALDDFMVDAERGEYVAVEDIVRRLKARYPRVNSFEAHKRDYMCALYGRFRGRGSAPWDEAQNAAKAWCQSIAYRPIGSVNDLVRDDILEFNAKNLQESISRISELMQQVTNLKREGKRLEDAVQQLDVLTAVTSKATAAYEELVLHELLQARLHQRNDNERIEKELGRKAEANARATRYEDLERERKKEREQLDERRIALSAQLSGIRAYSDKMKLEADLGRLTESASATLSALGASVTAAARLDNVARHLLGKPIPDQFPQLRTAVEAVARSLGATSLDRLTGLRDVLVEASSERPLNPSRLEQLAEGFRNSNDGLSEVYHRLVGTEQSVAMALAAEERSLESRRDSVEATIRELDATKQRLSTGGGDYPRETVPALELIRTRLPGAEVQVLCDLVEPLSLEWQPAIEGYMDGARFNLIVRQEFEAQAIELLQGVRSRCRVIQGAHCLKSANAARVPADSIIHELHTDNPIAKAYLIDQFGAVVKVRSTEELRFTSRGVTRDGKGSGSRTMFTSGSKSLVFGKAAREAALAEYGQKLDAAAQQARELEALNEGLKEVRRSLNGLKEPAFNAAPLGALAADIEHVQRSLSQLDLSEASELADELKQLKGELAELDTSIQAAQRAVVLADQEVEAAEEIIKTVRGRYDSRLRDVQLQTSRLARLCELNVQRTYPLMAQRVDVMLEDRRLDVAEVQQLLTTSLLVLPDQLLGDVRGLLADYNATARQEERFEAIPMLFEPASFEPYYSALLKLGAAAGELHQSMKSVGLYNNREEIEGAERSFHDVFTKQFCVEIKTKVDDGIRTLRQLNIELENLKFGGEKFSIDWTRWVPEYEEYYSFFKAVAELSESGDGEDSVDLFGKSELSEKHLLVRDRLRALLLDQDQDRASRELMRIADYRNYRQYEIWSHSSDGSRIGLSTWGTGSGGQLETPAYIVRAAVVTNRLKVFEKGPSLKLLVNDESFSKMDEQRARAVLRFLSDGLRLQVVSSMPTRNAGPLRDEFNREYSVSRAKVEANGELDFVTDHDERILKTDRMRALWEAQRAQAREQAALDFEAAEPRPQTGSTASEKSPDTLAPEVAA
ncbi:MULTISPECIES: SbcC/MukB-like Walker B domain-containing protein [unclassified Variovorax]|uniref:SbcC/MukB-like Walker B domain-containing protein n=1 Tax=unclassified Variovorax TaxID=663243 RepID=UPI00131942D9|nr:MULTISPECIES: SbcC/MukB-like Walker B domain-containing protein [unclassified Variovorax]VTU42966.1 chromosome segregation protein SMC [Variovorax sp. PBL-H6]VTU43551.1 chromosome segregation protein SMC [Variovorax sp. SRS16]VTU43612.1 chromosome segregation protein SMC [Variovorax sp. PBL-E5]